MTKRILLRAAVATITAATSLTMATPAHAVAGLEYPTAATATNSISPKSLTITCPVGKSAIGGGAAITGATGDVTIRSIVPTRVGATSYVAISAEEDPDGFAGSWRIDGIAVCVTTPAGLSYVTASGGDPALLWVTASCGAKRIIGSGYAVSHTAAAKATGVNPLSSNRAYLSVEPSRVAGAVVPITGTVIAVCATAALPGLSQVVVSSVANSVDGKGARATCPAGTQVIGVGGDLYQFRAHTVIDDFTVIPSTNSASVIGYEDQAGNPDMWAVEATAICAT